MKKASNFDKLVNMGVYTILGGLISACGNGNAGQAYYSASLNTYYQIITESSSNGSTPLSITINTSGNTPITASLTTSTANIYNFTTADGKGIVILKNGLLGYAYVANNAYTFNTVDFATQNAKSTIVPDGIYVTFCDQANLSPCLITISGNSIAITEYNKSNQGRTVSLCPSNSTLIKTTGFANPNLYTFQCGTNGSASNAGDWHLMPFTINGITGFMINEYTPTGPYKSTYNITNEIAFPQSSIAPNGNYSYLAPRLASNSNFLASVTNGYLTNSAIGCSSQSCILKPGGFIIESTPISQAGFMHFTAGTINYNFTGNTYMNIFMDSNSGFYF